MSERGAAKEQFHAFLSAQCKRSIDREDSLNAVRKKGWERLGEIGLPTENADVFKSIRLARLFTQQYHMSDTMIEQRSDFLDEPSPKRAVLVFVNGNYQPLLSKVKALPSSILVLPLDKAIVAYSIFLNHHWITTLKHEQDPFAVMNTILHRSGVFIYVPPKTTLDIPIEIVHVIEEQAPEQQPLMLVPRVHVCVGAHASVQLISSVQAPSQGHYCLNQACEIAIEENANVSYTHAALGQSVDAWHFDAVRVTQKRNSRFESLSITDGCGMLRNDYRIQLTGDAAEVSLKGICKLQGKSEAHTNVLIDHQAPGCRSRQFFKRVLNGRSRSSFEGKILVQREAQKTDAIQLDRALLLSDGAEVDSKPNLEIFADDVKASHGATVGQLDEEQIFYLRTRGFSEEAAKHFLIEAFCKEITEGKLLPVPFLIEVKNCGSTCHQGQSKSLLNSHPSRF